MLSIKVEAVIPISDINLLVFFENGKIKKFDVKTLFKCYPEFKTLENEDIFSMVKVEPGGYGISWNEDLDCSEGELYENGKDIDLTIDDFVSFIKYGLLNTSEAATALSCTKQNIEDLTKRNKLHPVKMFPKNKLYLKSEIEKRIV